MEYLKLTGSGIAVWLNTVADAVPTPVMVVFVLIVGCGPELRRMAETASDVAWKWRRGNEQHDRPGDASEDKVLSLLMELAARSTGGSAEWRPIIGC